MCNPVTTARPEVLLEKGVYANYEWEVVYNRIGYRCGYVRIPQGHPWHGKDYDDVRTTDGDYPDVHGGLTFAEPDADCGTDGADDAWWLGFDCAHAGDAPDPQLPGYHDYHDHMIERGTIRTTGYVAAECRKLAEQAAAVAVERYR